MTKLDEALGLFPSAIKCGDEWSPRCQSVLDEAKAELAAFRARPRYFSGCLLDGVCRGVCENTDCPNHDMVVAARVCVEPKEDGIMYPDEGSG